MYFSGGENQFFVRFGNDYIPARNEEIESSECANENNRAIKPL